MKKHIHDFDDRKRLWYELIDSEILTLFRERRVEDAYRLAEEIAGKEVINDAMAVTSN